MGKARNWRRTLAVLLAVLIGGASAASAQNPTFALEGIVTDAQQAVLPGVTVTIKNTATGLVRVITTDNGGRFFTRALPPEGRYDISVELPGFATEIRKDQSFNAGNGWY